TGVGKTELSRALAELLFGDEKSMIRIDMSEYMEKHSVSRLIGSPPGYVGYDEGGQLTEKVRRKPYSVVLFDEIEKAHPDVFNILLQIMEDGRLTDSHGRVVDFKNTVIIMTSNVGARNITEPKRLGFADPDISEHENYENMKKNVMEELKKTFRPEFLNRVDDIIVFEPLNKEQIVKIAHLLLNDLKKRARLNDIELSFDEGVAEFIADKGFDPVFGARPLKRAIQTHLEDKLSEGMLRGDIDKGMITIYIEDGTPKYRKTE
ncbi:MAG TPA: AAA family ATPase, partial [Clostridia bacterium]|nr:AAA family ATPase [Clostridia bacterium]